MSFVRVVMLALAVGSILVGTPPTMAQEPPVVRPRPELPPLYLSAEGNIERLLKIRLAFQKDPVIGPLNLGIQYRDGLVTLWGPVSSSKHIQSAKNLAAAQKGVTEVRSELYVGTTGERQTGPLPTTMLPEIPVRVQAASPNAQTGRLPPTPLRDDLSPPRNREQATEAGNAIQANGTAPYPGNSAIPAIVPTGQVLRFPSGEPGQAATAGLGSGPPGSEPVSRGLSNDRSVGQGQINAAAHRDEHKGPVYRLPTESPSERLLQMRSSNDRFKGITWSLRGGDLEIQYSGGDTVSPMDFARSAQTLPGIRSVTVRQRTALVP